MLDGGIFILTDINSQNTVEMRFFNVFYQVIYAVVIEAHTVNQPFGVNEAEQTRLIVTRLRTRRHGTDLDRTKSHSA